MRNIIPHLISSALLLGLLCAAPAHGQAPPAVDTTQVLSDRQMLQRIGWTMARLQNSIDELFVAKAHLLLDSLALRTKIVRDSLRALPPAPPPPIDTTTTPPVVDVTRPDSLSILPGDSLSAALGDSLDLWGVVWHAHPTRGSIPTVCAELPGGQRAWAEVAIDAAGRPIPTGDVLLTDDCAIQWKALDDQIVSVDAMSMLSHAVAVALPHAISYRFVAQTHPTALRVEVTLSNVIAPVPVEVEVMDAGSRLADQRLTSLLRDTDSLGRIVFDWHTVTGQNTLRVSASGATPILIEVQR